MIHIHFEAHLAGSKLKNFRIFKNSNEPFIAVLWSTHTSCVIFIKIALLLRVVYIQVKNIGLLAARRSFACVKKRTSIKKARIELSNSQDVLSLRSDRIVFYPFLEFSAFYIFRHIVFLDAWKTKRK